MRAQAPTYRPTWVLVLTSVMLLGGGFSLVTGLQKVADPGVVLEFGGKATVGSDAEVQLTRRLAAAREAAVEPHKTKVRAGAVVEILLALYTLYATAAVLSRDRNGRALALGVGALGIAYQIGTLPIYLSLMGDFAERGSDLFAQMAIQSAGGKTTASAADIARNMRAALMGVLILATAISVAGSMILLAFFGGRRGRALYGIDGPPSTRPGG